MVLLESDNMVKYSFIAYAGLAVALPLNINLGAYSPALVVGTVPPSQPAPLFWKTRLLTRPTGDGEISFGGRQDVSSLMNALEGAAVNAAAGAESAAAKSAPVVQAAPVASPVAVVPAASADPTLTAQVSLPRGHYSDRYARAYTTGTGTADCRHPGVG